MGYHLLYISISLPDRRRSRKTGIDLTFPSDFRFVKLSCETSFYRLYLLLYAFLCYVWHMLGIQRRLVWRYVFGVETTLNSSLLSDRGRGMARRSPRGRSHTRSQPLPGDHLETQRGPGPR